MAVARAMLCAQSSSLLLEAAFPLQPLRDMCHSCAALLTRTLLEK